LTNDRTPLVSGRVRGKGEAVTIALYRGSGATGTPVQRLNADVEPDGTFGTSARPVQPGFYTIVATLPAADGGPVRSSPNTFLHWRLGASRGPETIAFGTLARDVTAREADVRKPAAAFFDGVDDRIVVLGSRALSATRGVTVEAWVKRRKSGEWQNVIAKPGDGPAAAQNYALWLNPENRAVAIFGGDGNSHARVDSPIPLDDEWHYLSATYDNRIARMYVDGAVVNSSPSNARLTPNSLPVTIGWGEDHFRVFGGLLAEVAMVGKALSPTQIRRRYTAQLATFDIAPPAVTLTTPEAGSATADTTPAFAGMAGLRTIDRAAVSVKLYRRASGRPLQTLTTTRLASGSWSVSSSSPLPPGSYTARAVQGDSAGRIGRSSVNTFRVETRVRSSDPVLVGAGDIAYCEDTGDEATAALLDGIPGTVFTLGDNAYEVGTPREYALCYDPSWGRHKARTRPTLGGHDYGDGRDDNARGYFTYFRNELARFGPSALDPRRGWYSYDLGAWHIVVLNTTWREVGLPQQGSEQVRWLRADLAAHSNKCTLAMWHDPLFSSGLNGGSVSYRPLWDGLYAYGADLVLNGHDHDYERFAPQDPSGAYDPVRGIRELVVGTGGRSHYPFGSGKGILAHSEVRNDDTYGVLKLVLHPTGYDWEFIPQAGKSFVDSGSASCH
jgi:hypothetical protein